MRLGILTGGGDVPGLNACDQGRRRCGPRRRVTRSSGSGAGGAGSSRSNPDDPATIARNSVHLDPGGGPDDRPDRRHVPPHLGEDESGEGAGRRRAGVPGRRGARTTARATTRRTSIRVIDHLGLDALIPIGGDDTLSFALRLHEEGVPVVAIPKTMDNDVHGTDYCIGFSTAITRTVNFVHQLRTSAGSHERLAVVEVFGRYSGETSLVVGVPVGRRPGDHLARCRSTSTRLGRAADAGQAREPQQLRDDDDLGGRHDRSAARWCRAGPRMRTGTRSWAGSASSPRELLKERTGEGMIYQQLGYLMRSGSPDSLDLMVAINYAVMAADLAIEGSLGPAGGAAQRQLRERTAHRPRPGREAGRRRVRCTTARPTGRRSATSTASRCSCTEPSGRTPLDSLA